MKYCLLACWSILLTLSNPARAQRHAIDLYAAASKPQKDILTRIYLAPQRIVWQSDSTLISNSAVLLQQGNSQAYFGNKNVCRITSKSNHNTGLVLDFGKEIHGGIQITTSQSNRVTRRVRVRLGESVSEAMSDVIGDGTTGKEGGATNHHAMRDFVVELPGYGTLEIGNSGFRFVRLDLVDNDSYVVLKEVRAVAVLRDIAYRGSFNCDDERLNQIWQTGAYTVHLNMQDYLWDGIKRDRMVWAGDMHPEIMTISSVFGYNEVVPKSLDFLRDHTPLPAWMNGISSYSLWWIIMQHDWFRAQGDTTYLRQQKSYLLPLLSLFATKVDVQGNEKLDTTSMRFMDWPSYSNKVAVHAGLQSLMVMAFEKGAALCRVLGEVDKAWNYEALAAIMRRQVPDAGGAKQSAALMALAGLMPAQKANDDVIAKDGVKDFSTFFGYYLLQAQAKAGAYYLALDNIRQYWGGMLDLGATTFWEDFNLAEAADAARIDEVVPAGKKDYHYSTGAYSYIGLRRSLCHGWASGPTAWLTEHVLGVQIVQPGGKVVRIEPHLGNLKWVEGSYPTRYGVIKIKHVKQANGKIITTVSAPKGVTVLKSS